MDVGATDTQATVEELARHEKILRLIFKCLNEFEAADAAQKNSASVLSLREWLSFLRVVALIGDDVTERDATLSFVWSRMAVVNSWSASGHRKDSELPFEGFLVIYRMRALNHRARACRLSPRAPLSISQSFRPPLTRESLIYGCLFVPSLACMARWQEALCRLSALKALPTQGEIDSAECFECVAAFSAPREPETGAQVHPHTQSPIDCT